MDQIWSELRLEDATSQEQIIMLKDIVYKGFEYFTTIRNFQKAQSAANKKQIPIRQIVTTVATHTAGYSMQRQATKNWPFDGDMSEFYQFEDAVFKADSIAHYANFPDMVNLHYTILIDGVGALVAVMTAASEVLQ